MEVSPRTNALFSCQLGAYRFAPRLFPTLITAILLPFLISLGFWQLQRAEQKQQILTEYQARPQAQPLTLSAFKNSPLEKLQYFPLHLTGVYDNAHSLLLDNKMYQHRVGYQVLTPFIPAGEKSILLVNRGWIARNSNRQDLPKIPAIVGEQTITGLIYQPPAKSFLLNRDAENQQWPLIIQALEITQLQKFYLHPLYPVVVLLSPQQQGGFVRDWHPVTTPPYKNIGYAVQWFALAAALLIIYVVVNVRKKNG